MHDNIWCPVIYGNYRGWANAYFLAYSDGRRVACVIYPKAQGCTLAPLAQSGEPNAVGREVPILDFEMRLNAASAQDIAKIEYQSSCATCHGTDGKGNGPISPLLNVSPPDLTVLERKITAYFPLALFIKSLTGDKRSRPMALATCRFGATRTPWARLGSRFHTIPKCSCAVAF